jgi:hypothetical protein
LPGWNPDADSNGNTDSFTNTNRKADSDTTSSPNSAATPESLKLQCDVYKMTKHECRMPKELEQFVGETCSAILLVATGLWPVQTKLAFTRSERLTEPWLQNACL